jgi:hypothetical protein
MRSMASKVTLTWKDGTAIIPPEVFKGIGELTFEQLSGLRHRGAFSTVALTFARCCQLTQSQLASEQLKNSYLLERWYQVWLYTLEVVILHGYKLKIKGNIGMHFRTSFDDKTVSGDPGLDD